MNDNYKIDTSKFGIKEHQTYLVDATYILIKALYSHIDNLEERLEILEAARRIEQGYWS